MEGRREEAGGALDPPLHNQATRPAEEEKQGIHGSIRWSPLLSGPLSPLPFSPPSPSCHPTAVGDSWKASDSLGRVHRAQARSFSLTIVSKTSARRTPTLGSHLK